MVMAGRRTPVAVFFSSSGSFLAAVRAASVVRDVVAPDAPTTPERADILPVVPLAVELPLAAAEALPTIDDLAVVAPEVTEVLPAMPAVLMVL